MSFPVHGLSKRIFSLASLFCLFSALTVSVVSGYGYSTDYEGYIGEIIGLSGVSYNSDQIYLFMTGPGLPENGVALTDTSKRADAGGFTTVDVDSSQKWSYKWDTMRLENQIDPGTYTIYAVNAPVDKSHLAGHSYQTLTAYLKDGRLSHDRVSVGTKYTVNLADDDPNVTYTIRTVPPTSPPTTLAPDTPVATASPVTPLLPTGTPTKKAVAFPALAILALIGAACISRQNQK